MAVATDPVSPSRHYETIYVLRPDVVKDSASAVATRVKDVMGREGGEFTSVQTWGRRALAYRIGKHRHGIYVYVSYLGGGGLVKELERNLRMLDTVIRFQTVLLGTEPAAPAEGEEAPTTEFEDVEGIQDEAAPNLAHELGLFSPDRPPRAERPAPADSEAEGAEGAAKATADDAGAETAAEEKPAAETPKADAGSEEDSK